MKNLIKIILIGMLITFSLINPQVSSGESLNFIITPNETYTILSNETLDLEWVISVDNSTQISYEIMMKSDVEDTLLASNIVDISGVISISLQNLPSSIYNITNTVISNSSEISSLVRVIVLDDDFLNTSESGSNTIYPILGTIFILILFRKKY